jgi:hypothetical protein
MSAQFFLYTWKVPVGHETTDATITVRAETPDQAILAVKNETAGLARLYNSIDPWSIDNKYGRESAESLKTETGSKLRIIAATVLGIPIGQTKDELTSPVLSGGIVELLQRIQPTVEPTFTPSFRWDREPQISHYVPVRG